MAHKTRILSHLSLALIIVGCLAASQGMAARPKFTVTKLGGNTGRMGDLPSFSQLALGPDGNLYATRTLPGQIWRFKLDSTGIIIGEELLIGLPLSVNLINGLTFDPSATSGNLVFYFSQVEGGGKIYRVKVGPWGNATVLQQTLLIDKIGIFGNHATNNLAFGKNGLLYITLSGQSYAGIAEKPWTAAIGEVNLAHSSFLSPPVDISRTDVLGDTVYTGTEPIKLFATGLRNPHGILQHSNGLLYGTAHDPYDSDKIHHPSGIGFIDNATTFIPDLLVRLERGKYYGHTNATRGQFVYFGANPTSGVDPFEVKEMPVGTKSAMDLKLIQGVEHHTCIAGLDEYIDGSLLVSQVKDRANLIGHVEWFDLDANGYFVPPNAGDVVVKHDYIKDVNDKAILFGGVLDALVTAKGWIYVADFGLRVGNDGGGDIAGLYLLKPTGQVAVRKRPTGRLPETISWNGQGVAIKLRKSQVISVELLDLKGQAKIVVFNGSLSVGGHFLPLPKDADQKGIKLLRIIQNGIVFSSVIVSL